AGGQGALVPVQRSARSQVPAAGRQTKADGWSLSAGHWFDAPSHSSATSQGPAAGRHCAMLLASAGHAAPVPVQCSARSHSPAEARQTVLDGSKASAGQAVLDPVQVSSTSQGPADARQTAAAFPAGCWQASLLPSHSSRLHGLPSSVHAVPAGFFVSAGQLAPVPVQCSAGSHSPAAARHSTLDDAKASAGQTVLVPVQVSATSQSPATARQTAAAFPAGCWQASLLPSHSSRLHGLPSSVQAAPA